MLTPVFRMKPAAFIDRFVVGTDSRIEASANAWVKETVGTINDGSSEMMIRNAYATGLKVWVPSDEMEQTPRRYFYGPDITGHMALDKDERLVLVTGEKRTVYMSQAACYDADAHYALLRGRRIWVGKITGFALATGLVSFRGSPVDPLDLVKLVSDDPVTEGGKDFYIVDTSHPSTSLLGRKPHGYTYLNARPDDTYPESRYEHVSTSATSQTETDSHLDSRESGESGEFASSAGPSGSTSVSDYETAHVTDYDSEDAHELFDSESDSNDSEFERLLATAPPPQRTQRTPLIYPPLKPPRRLRTRRASKRRSRR